MLAVILAVVAGATVCPPVEGDNSENLRSCLALAAQTDNRVQIGGTYTIISPDPITIPPGVTLEGVPSAWGATISVDTPPSLYSYDDDDHATFILGNGSAVRGVTAFYPRQLWTKGLAEYPPFIALAYRATDVTISDSFFINAYVAISAWRRSSRVNVLNNRYGEYFRMVRINENYDIDRIINNHSNPGLWPGKGDATERKLWRHANAVGIELGRADWPRIDQFFAWGVKVGILLTQSPQGIAGVVNIDQSDCDACAYGIYSDVEVAPYPRLLSISGWGAAPYDPNKPSQDPENQGTAIYLRNVNEVNVSNSKFFAARDDAIHIENANVVSINGNVFRANGWNITRKGTAAIRLVGCSNAAVVGNAGKNDYFNSRAIVIESGDNIKVLANAFQLGGGQPVVIFDAQTQNSFALGNGSVDDSGQNNVVDVSFPCRPVRRHLGN